MFRIRHATFVDAGDDTVPFLPTVHTLLLEMDGLREDACTRTECPCDCRIPSSEVDELLVEASPNVRVLSCTSPGLDLLNAFPYLTHLQVWVRGTWEGMLEPLMQGVPMLTHFAYWSVNMHGPRPREVQRALEPRGDTLECLSLSYSKPLIEYAGRTSPLFDWPPPIQDWLLEPFTDFKKLTSLYLDDHMIWQHVDDGYPVVSKTPPTLFRNLVPFLPPALEGLYLFNSVGMELPIGHLAQSMVDETMPTLRKVFWSEPGFDSFVAMDWARRHSERWLEDKLWRREVDQDADEELVNGLRAPFISWQDIKT